MTQIAEAIIDDYQTLSNAALELYKKTHGLDTKIPEILYSSADVRVEISDEGAEQYLLYSNLFQNPLGLAKLPHQSPDLIKSGFQKGLARAFAGIYQKITENKEI